MYLQFNSLELNVTSTFNAELYELMQGLETCNTRNLSL